MSVSISSPPARFVHRVEVPGAATLHVESSGAGRAVVFAHGLWCDGRVFARQAADVARERHALSVDLRGHGRSSVPTRDYRMTDQALDLLEVMDQLSLERAVLVGHAMGGMAALRAAHLHPERVAGLVLLGTSHRAEHRVQRLESRAMARLYRDLGGHAAVGSALGPVLVGHAVRRLFGRPFRRRHPEVVASWRRRALRLERSAVWRAVRCVAQRRDLGALLPAIRVPALVVVGALDRETPPAIARDLAARLPDAHLEVMPRVGHLVALEAPGRTSALVRAFCESIGW